jgi:hypothetical protein
VRPSKKTSSRKGEKTECAAALLKSTGRGLEFRTRKEVVKRKRKKKEKEKKKKSKRFHLNN